MSKNILLGITGSVAASKSEILFGKVSKNNNVKIIVVQIISPGSNVIII
mgnify:CR=1 FL=1